jgi:hypothetical protein
MKRVVIGVQPSQIHIGDKICIKLTEGLPPDETLSPYQLIYLGVTSIGPWLGDDERYFITGDDYTKEGWPTGIKRGILTSLMEQIERFDPRRPSEALLVMQQQINILRSERHIYE